MKTVLALPAAQLHDLSPALREVNSFLQNRRVAFPQTEGRRKAAFGFISALESSDSDYVQHALTMGVCAIKQGVDNLSDPSESVKHQAVLELYQQAQNRKPTINNLAEASSVAAYCFFVLAVSFDSSVSPIEAMSLLSFSPSMLEPLALLYSIVKYGNIEQGCRSFLESYHNAPSASYVQAFLDDSCDKDSKDATTCNDDHMLGILQLFAGSWTRDTVLRKLSRLTKCKRTLAMLILNICSSVETTTLTPRQKSIELMCWMLLPEQPRKIEQV